MTPRNDRDSVATVGTLLALATPFVLHEKLEWAIGWAATVGLVAGLLVGVLFVTVTTTLKRGPALAWLWLRVWAFERRKRTESR